LNRQGAKSSQERHAGQLIRTYSGRGDLGVLAVHRYLQLLRRLEMPPGNG
jgi:hypothetical protein